MTEKLKKPIYKITEINQKLKDTKISNMQKAILVIQKQHLIDELQYISQISIA